MVENYLLIECLECNTVFREQDIEKTSKTIFCECKNLSIGPRKTEYGRCSFHVAVVYSKARPRIYELKGINEKKQKNILP